MNMMNGLLRNLRTMPLTLPACEEFLYQSAIMVITSGITIDDWVYLIHLIAYRTTTRLNASDRDKERMASLMRKIVKEKDRLDDSQSQREDHHGRLN